MRYFFIFLGTHASLNFTNAFTFANQEELCFPIGKRQSSMQLSTISSSVLMLLTAEIHALFTTPCTKGKPSSFFIMHLTGKVGPGIFGARAKSREDATKVGFWCHALQGPKFNSLKWSLSKSIIAKTHYYPRRLPFCQCVASTSFLVLV